MRVKIAVLLNAALLGGLWLSATAATLTVANPADSGPDSVKHLSSMPTVSTQPASQSVPVSDLGVMANAQYHGDGLSVTPVRAGGRLRCVFQKLEAEVTPEGLWMVSTREPLADAKFRIVASAVGRTGTLQALPAQGVVNVTDKQARYVRPGLTEEYSVSVDGVRQDFVVTQRPTGGGALRVELEVKGARAEARAGGARLLLDGSNRKLAYDRLRVFDAAGKTLAARLEVMTESRLAVVVEDAAAAYPVRIDPTFSDADWSGLGGMPNNSVVLATVVDGSGNLYIGGNFTNVGGVPANNIAKWDGHAWSALGSGVSNGSYDPIVYALAVSGSDLYVGGVFIEAGGREAICIAKWNGIAWSPVGTGVDAPVGALAFLGTNLYAGGDFTMAGGTLANRMAKWDGRAWSALGSGVDNTVRALAVMGTNLFVGGWFTMAGDTTVNHVARWDGNAWSRLQNELDWVPGVNGNVYALSVMGTNLFVGGAFGKAGGYYNTVNVARWDGSEWWEVYPGVNNTVFALAVSGTNLYVGGAFTRSGPPFIGLSANYIAKWDGSTWSALGSGLNDWVMSLAVSGSSLYVGGYFTNAGGIYTCGLARANIGAAPSPAAPFFTSIIPNAVGSQALLTFTSDPGATFYLLSSTNLTTWQTNTTVNATASTNSVWINVTQPREFFRMRLQ